MTLEIEKRIKAVKAGRVPAGYKKTKVGIVPKEWNEVRFHDMFSRVTRKNKEGNTNVLTISAQHGLINQNEFFNKTIASDDKSNYYLMEKGEFAYNKSYSNGYPFGALKRLDYYDKGIVSPLYICFSANENNKYPDFYVHYFEAGLMNREIQAFAQEGARNHGLLNISVDDFFNSNLLNPPLSEQKKIAEILSAQDKIIELKEKLIAEKQRQKKYLMKELLDEDAKQAFKLNGIVIDKKQWKKIFLKDVCNFFDSERKPVKETDRQKGIYPYYGASGVIDYVDSYIFDGSYILLGEDGANIVFRSSPLAFKVSGKVWVNNHAHVLAPKDNNDIDFLVNYLESLNYEKYNTGTAQPKLNQDVVEKIELLMPSLPEQQAIAVVLSFADEEIALLQRDLEQEKLKKKSLMQLLLIGLVRV